jgi:hypothetical protein
MTYDDFEDNVWISPVYKGFKLICCNCGLLHEVDFRIYKGKIQLRLRRKGFRKVKKK